MSQEPRYLTEKIKEKFDYEIKNIDGCRVVILRPKKKPAVNN